MTFFFFLILDLEKQNLKVYVVIILSNNLINLACFRFCVRAARLSETQENDFHAQDVSQDARLT